MGNKLQKQTISFYTLQKIVTKLIIVDFFQQMGTSTSLLLIVSFKKKQISDKQAVLA